VTGRPAGFDAVVADVARGLTVGAASRRYGLSEDLAEAMVDEAERLGLLARYTPDCLGCAPAPGKACAGCPLTRVRRPV